MHRLAQPLFLCCAIALLYGCHRHDGTPVEPIAATPKAAPAAARSSKPATASHAAPATTAPAPAASATKAAANDDAFRVATLTLGSAIDAGYAVTAPATRFAADTPTIYASVATTGRTDGATLAARWRYLEGQGVLVNELSQTVATAGPPSPPSRCRTRTAGPRASTAWKSPWTANRWRSRASRSRAESE